MLSDVIATSEIAGDFDIPRIWQRPSFTIGTPVRVDVNL
jgi:hypothetical protein